MAPIVGEIQTPEAWLVAVVTRLSIDRLRRASTERETYDGPWLPEPLTRDPFPPADRRAEMASDLSMAFLVMLERLAPEERAAFLLREVFGEDYGTLARVLDRSEVACRKMVQRARERVRRDRPRFGVPTEARERLVDQFLEALERQDEAALLALVAPDVSFTSDGGGRVAAARNVIRGESRIVRFLLGLQSKWMDRVRHEKAWVNGEPAVLTFAAGRLFAVTTIDTDGERVRAFYRVLNPDKLGRLGGGTGALHRRPPPDARASLRPGGGRRGTSAAHL